MSSSPGTVFTVGPALTKRALVAAGEIKAEGRTSARRRNKGKTQSTA